MLKHILGTLIMVAGVICLPIAVFLGLLWGNIGVAVALGVIAIVLIAISRYLAIHIWMKYACRLLD